MSFSCKAELKRAAGCKSRAALAFGFDGAAALR